MIQKRIQSFRWAFEGLRTVWNSGVNFRIQILAATLVIITGLLVGLATWEWSVLLLCIAAVLSLECLNTALEELCNRVEPSRDPVIKKVKDMSAAAVLIASFISVICGALIFLPHI